MKVEVYIPFVTSLKTMTILRGMIFISFEILSLSTLTVTINNKTERFYKTRPLLFGVMYDTK